MAKVQRISIEQYDKLTTWLRANKEQIEAGQLTQLTTAARAGGELGFKVPLSSIQRCAKMAKIEWVNSPPKPPPVPLDHEAIVILIGALCGIYIETGKTVPDNLANLQSRYVKEDIPEPKEPELDKSRDM